nr:hypothetical protein Iba_chr14aCG1890 [Ipomoea batatas]
MTAETNTCPPLVKRLSLGFFKSRGHSDTDTSEFGRKCAGNRTVVWNKESCPATPGQGNLVLEEPGIASFGQSFELIQANTLPRKFHISTGHSWTSYAGASRRSNSGVRSGNMGMQLSSVDILWLMAYMAFNYFKVVVKPDRAVNVLHMEQTKEGAVSVVDCWMGLSRYRLSSGNRFSGRAVVSGEKPLNCVMKAYAWGESVGCAVLDTAKRVDIKGALMRINLVINNHSFVCACHNSPGMAFMQWLARSKRRGPCIRQPTNVKKLLMLCSETGDSAAKPTHFNIPKDINFSFKRVADLSNNCPKIPGKGICSITMLEGICTTNLERKVEIRTGYYTRVVSFSDYGYTQGVSLLSADSCLSDLWLLHKMTRGGSPKR